MTIEKTIEHVNSLNSIAKLEQADFEGIDTSLDISLFEYGMVWKDIGEETLFVYGFQCEDIYNKFDRCIFANETDVLVEFDWADFKELVKWNEMTLDEWKSMPLPRQIYDLSRYYGIENVFGSIYWDGFEIEY